MKATNQYKGGYRNTPPSGVRETVVGDCMFLGFVLMFFAMLVGYEDIGLGLLAASTLFGVALYIKG